MASKTLYRRFRPRDFGSVSGQKQVTRILSKQVETGQPAHAYLFCGTRGTGKTTTARILANAVNCLHPRDGNPCGECEVCRACQEGRFPDIIEIDAASNNGVDNIREIREQAALLPMQGKYKVYIIDEAHMLSSGAFNALLKTLEEPPDQTIFILATTELRKVPRTILSRCQHFDFHRISDRDIQERLQFVTEKIGVQAEEEALRILAQQSDGALRDALSLLEQCIAGRQTLSAADVLETLGISDVRLVADLAGHMIAGDTAAAAAALAALLDSGTSPVHAQQDLVMHLTQRLARAASSGEDPKAVLRAAEILIEAQNTMRFSPVPQAVLLTAVIRVCEPAADPDLRHLDIRLRRLEEKVAKLEASGVPQIPAPPVYTPPPAPAAAPAPAPIRTAGSKAALKRLQERLRQDNPAAGPGAGVLTGAEIVGTSLVLHALPDDAPLAVFLTDTMQIERTLAAAKAVYGDTVAAVRLDLTAAEDEEDESAEKVIEKLNQVFKNRVTVKKD